jgi:soluble lytic murein transglycosylase-like protein
MKHNPLHKPFLIWTFFALLGAGHFISPSPALSDYHLLRKYIIAYNQEALKESLIDDTHRGEEGVLRIRPEIGKSLGIKVFMDQDYLNSKELFEKSDVFLEDAKMALRSGEKEKSQGDHIQMIADLFLSHKWSLELAKKKLAAYRSRLNASLDDRLDETVSIELMDRLLEESLKKTDSRLRDALGLFFNTCLGQDRSNLYLTPENVTFVNQVLHGFINEASEKELKMFDLDQDRGSHKNPSYNWKNAVEKRASKYIPLFEATLKKTGNKTYKLDPLLFFALMKRESQFKALAISPVGAVGLTQIMPKTGKDLGMKNIYDPSYFGKAVSLMRQERRTRGQAEATLLGITETNKLSQVQRALELMQNSLRLGKEREKLFAKYKRELLKKRTDDRLDPSLAIEYGLTYFARQMRAQRGDMSLALASYNAGPGAVRKYKGIPPYEETVYFRNKVLQYYRDYRRKVQGNNH